MVAHLLQKEAARHLRPLILKQEACSPEDVVGWKRWRDEVKIVKKKDSPGRQDMLDNSACRAVFNEREQAWPQKFAQELIRTRHVEREDLVLT